MNDLNLIDSFNTNIEELLKSGLIEPEIASDENTASPITFERRSYFSRFVGIGLPIKIRLNDMWSPDKKS